MEAGLRVLTWGQQLEHLLGVWSLDLEVWCSDLESGLHVWAWKSKSPVLESGVRTLESKLGSVEAGFGVLT